MLLLSCAAALLLLLLQCLLPAALGKQAPIGRANQIWIALSVGATPVLWFMLFTPVFAYSGTRATSVFNALTGSLVLVPFLIGACLLIAAAVSLQGFRHWHLTRVAVWTAIGIWIWATLSVCAMKMYAFAFLTGVCIGNYVTFLRQFKEEESVAAPRWLLVLWFLGLAAAVVYKPVADSAIIDSVRDMLSLQRWGDAGEIAAAFPTCR